MRIWLKLGMISFVVVSVVLQSVDEGFSDVEDVANGPFALAAPKKVAINLLPNLYA